MQVKDRLGRLPLLGEDDRPVTQPEPGAEQLVYQEGRERPRELGLLAELSVVDTPSVISADPLDPAVQVQVPSRLVPRKVRVPDEPQMGLEAEGCEGIGQSLDACREPARARIGIDSLEREHVELHGGSAPIPPAGLLLPEYLNIVAMSPKNFESVCPVRLSLASPT